MNTFIVRCVKDKPALFAKVLQKSMKGAGTDDDSLLRVIISRCEVDMVQIKIAFEREYKKSLGKWISVSKVEGQIYSVSVSVNIDKYTMHTCNCFL